MQILESHIDKNSATFKANNDRMQKAVSELRSRIAAAREGGGSKYVQRHREQGKLTVRATDGTTHEFQASKETLQDFKAGDRIEAKLRTTPPC